MNYNTSLPIVFYTYHVELKLHISHKKLIQYFEIRCDICTFYNLEKYFTFYCWVFVAKFIMQKQKSCQTCSRFDRVGRVLLKKRCKRTFDYLFETQWQFSVYKEDKKVYCCKFNLVCKYNSFTCKFQLLNLKYRNLI